MTEWQTSCLSALKIDRWVLKRQEEMPRCYVCVDLPCSVPAKALLKAMLAYKGLTMADVRLVSQIKQASAGVPLWLLDAAGDSVQLEASNRVLKTTDLALMLKKPMLKKQIFLGLSDWVVT